MPKPNHGSDLAPTATPHAALRGRWMRGWSRAGRARLLIRLLVATLILALLVPGLLTPPDVLARKRHKPTPVTEMSAQDAPVTTHVKRPPVERTPVEGDAEDGAGADGATVTPADDMPADDAPVDPTAEEVPVDLAPALDEAPTEKPTIPRIPKSTRPPSDGAATEQPTVVEVPPTLVPVVPLAADACATSDGYDLQLVVRVRRTTATIADALVVLPDGGGTASAQLPTVPATLDPGQTRWTWHFAVAETVSGGAPTALLVRVAELPGSEAANQLAGDGQPGWRLAALPSAPAPCPGVDEPAATSTNKATVVPPSDAPSKKSRPTKVPLSAAELRTAASPAAETPEATAIPTEAAVSEQVSIEALSADGTAVSGGQVRYTFRVRNTVDDAAVTVRLSVTNSLPGWKATVAPKGTTAAQDIDPLTIPAGAFTDILVTVSVPGTAHVEDKNTTRLDAEPLTPMQTPERARREPGN